MLYRGLKVFIVVGFATIAGDWAGVCVSLYLFGLIVPWPSYRHIDDLHKPRGLKHIKQQLHPKTIFFLKVLTLAGRHPLRRFLDPVPRQISQLQLRLWEPPGWGFPKLGGCLVGVLIIRESYYLEDYISGHLFSYTPSDSKLITESEFQEVLFLLAKAVHAAQVFM